MISAAQKQEAGKRYKAMEPVLDEQSRRRFVALEARALGHGGVSAMAKITGMARRTIYHGMSDIDQKKETEPTRIRKKAEVVRKKQKSIRRCSLI